MSHAVLLVEDDKSIATVITEALREDGFEVTACESIERRDVLLGHGRFDVMLTDVGRQATPILRTIVTITQHKQHTRALLTCRIAPAYVQPPSLY